MIQKAIEFGAETLTVPFELVEHMKDRMAESANKNMEAGQVVRAALIGQVVAAQHILATSYHLRYTVWKMGGHKVNFSQYVFLGGAPPRKKTMKYLCLFKLLQ